MFRRKIDRNRPFADLEKLMFGGGVKWLDTRDFKGSKYQLFREGIDSGRPEETYEVLLMHWHLPLGVVVVIDKLI